MNHEQAQEQVSRFVDNDLPEKESAVFFAHLAECLQCREFFRAALQLRSGLKTDTMPVPAGVDSKLRRQFSTSTSKPRRSGSVLWGRTVTLRVPALALLICIVAVVAVLTSSGRSLLRGPETVYVTKLPAVIITNGGEAPAPRN